MSEAKSKTEKKADPRTYVVLEFIPADEAGEQGAWHSVGKVEATDEKEARWAAVDQNSDVARRVKEGAKDGKEPVILVAISERNWSPKPTYEAVVETTKRS